MKLVIFLNKNGGGAFVKAPEVWTVDDAEFLCEHYDLPLPLSHCRFTHSCYSAHISSSSL